MNKRQLVLAPALVIAGTVVGALMPGGASGAWPGQAKQPPGLTQVDNQAAGASPRWEYQLVFGNQYNAARAISDLNKLGEQGFDVAGYDTSIDANGIHYFSVLLKRIKP